VCHVLGARRIQHGACLRPLAQDVGDGLVLVPLNVFGYIPSLEVRGLVAAYLVQLGTKEGRALFAHDL